MSESKSKFDWIFSPWRRTVQIHGRAYLLHGLFFKFRGLLMVPLLAMLLFMPADSTHSHVSLILRSLPIFFAGAVLRGWAQRYLWYRLSDRPDTFAAGGPYAFMRNPVYAGNILLLVGIALFCGPFWTAPLTMFWASLIYSLAIPFEEARLLKRFGAPYAEYLKSVHRWWPQVPKTSHSDAAARAPFTSVILAEWQVFLLIMVPLTREIYLGHLA